jgi:hypothetical protein
MDSVEEWVARNGVTICPPAYCASVQGATPLRIGRGEVECLQHVTTTQRHKQRKKLEVLGVPKPWLAMAREVAASKVRAKSAARDVVLLAEWAATRDLVGMAERHGVCLKRMRELLRRLDINPSVYDKPGSTRSRKKEVCDAD